MKYNSFDFVCDVKIICCFALQHRCLPKFQMSEMGAKKPQGFKITATYYGHIFNAFKTEQLHKLRMSIIKDIMHVIPFA